MYLPVKKVGGLLTDIGTEELNHMENHLCHGISADSRLVQSKGDALADLFEDLAAEQKARTVYENLLRVIDDPDVIAPLKFLRAREIVHFQRFGEALEMTKETLISNNFYHFNPEFDKRKYNLP